MRIFWALFTPVYSGSQQYQGGQILAIHLIEVRFPHTSQPLGKGRGGLDSKYAQMCVSKSEGHCLFFSLEVSEMNEKISLKMGVKFAVSLNMGDKNDL